MEVIKFSATACQAIEKYKFSINNNYYLRIKKSARIARLIINICNILRLNVVIHRGLLYNYIQIIETSNASAKNYLFNFARVLHFISYRDLRRFVKLYSGYTDFTKLRILEGKLNILVKADIDFNTFKYNNYTIQEEILRMLRDDKCGLSFTGIRQTAVDTFVKKKIKNR